MKENISKIRSDAERFCFEIESHARTITRLSKDLNDACKVYRNAYENWLKHNHPNCQPEEIAKADIFLDDSDFKLRTINKDITVQLSCMLSARAHFREATTEYDEALFDGNGGGHE